MTKLLLSRRWQKKSKAEVMREVLAKSFLTYDKKIDKKI